MDSQKHPGLENFPVVVELPVVWGEMDAFGHVNNVVYFRYFESVRILYLEKIGFLQVMENTHVGPILASTSCKFRNPLVFPDTILVGARVSEIKEDRFVMKYQIVSETLNMMAAEGEGLIVSYHYEKRHKIALPGEVLKGIEALESH